MSKISLIVAGSALIWLTACETTRMPWQQQSVQSGYISPHARGLMPNRQDLSKIVRGTEDGCYYEMMDGTAQGYLSPIQNPYHEGEQVCDPIEVTE